MFSKEDIRSLVSEYSKSGKNTELELRTKTNRDVFAKLYKQFYDKAEQRAVKQYITFIDSPKRKEIEFVNGKKIGETCIEKKVIRRISKGKFSIVISKEIPIDKFNMSGETIVRCKFRVTMKIGDWNYDFTMVRTVGKERRMDLPQIRDNLFSHTPPISPEDFISRIPDSLNDTYEVEIEFRGSKLSDDLLQDMISSISGSTEYSDTIREVAMLLYGTPASQLKQIVSQPRTLTIAEYKNIDITDYYVSDKADGDRCLIYISDSAKILSHTIVNAKCTSSRKLIIDAEKIDNYLYIFDVIFDRESLIRMPYEKRLLLIPKVLEEVKIEGYILEAKPVERGKDAVAKIYNRKRTYPIDGLIFTPAVKNTNSSDLYRQRIWKWKPADKLTIDFLVVEAPKTLLGIEPYIPQEGKKVYLLFNGIDTTLAKNLGKGYIKNYKEIFAKLKTKIYIPTHFSPPDNPNAYVWHYGDIPCQKIGDTGMTVVELSYNGDWNFIKCRDDKMELVKEGISFGNDYVIAMDIWNEINNPLTLEMLTSPDKIDIYFSKSKDQKYIAQTAYNSFVKSKLIQVFEKADLVVDLASGKGQDIFRYDSVKVRHLICADIDKSAIAELNRRALKIKSGMHVTTHVIDISDPYESVIKSIGITGADGVVINFAIHYIVGNEAAIKNLYNIVNSVLRPGGRFIFTCFDGYRVFQLLKDRDIWESGDKYSIKKMYKSSEFKTGLEIGVRLPFSTEYYKEYLTDIDEICKKFKGFSIERNSGFGEYMDLFSKENASMFSKLDLHDKEYVSLYQAVVLWKDI